MKTLFAANEKFNALSFETLSVKELGQVKGGLGPGEEDLFWDDDMNDPQPAKRSKDKAELSCC